MDANLISSSAPSANPLSLGASTASSGVDATLASPMNGQEFAGLMRDILNSTGRQDVAALGADAAANGLQTTALGEQFAVITSATPLPDASSLAAFARAQGLGEGAVKALFGELAPDATALTAAPMVNLDAASMLSAQAFGWNPLAAGLPQAPTTLTTPTLTTTALAAGQASTASLVTSAATLGWLSAHPSAAPGTVAPAPAISTAPQVADLNQLLDSAGATAVLQSLPQTNALGGLAPLANPSANPTLSEAPPELGPLDAMRMRLVPAWEAMTRQLSKLTGSEQSTTWANLMTSNLEGLGKKSAAEQAPLDLGATDIGSAANMDVDLGLALANALSDGSTATPLNAGDNTRAPTSLAAIANSSISATGIHTALTDRAEQIQQLANKLGQALGERLQEQMERGQWRLELKLNPGHLGQIDVELDMHAGGLDALFKTDNLLTRELITQGMSKLKDSLAQAGMAVADVWVNSESRGESGGKPTPSQTGAPDSQRINSGSETTSVVNRVQDKRSADAWDTLA